MNPSGPLSVARAVIHEDAVLRVLNGALDRAKQLGVRACISVVDSGGHPAAFVRMTGAFLISGDLATQKAKSTVSVGIPAEVVEQVLAQEAPRVREGILQSGFVMIRGGIPLRDGDQLIGAIGVSGGSESQDVECALAGVAALGTST